MLSCSFVFPPHRDIETQRHRDAETQRHRDTETQRHRDTETQRHRDTDKQAVMFYLHIIFYYHAPTILTVRNHFIMQTFHGEVIMTIRRRNTAVVNVVQGVSNIVAKLIFPPQPGVRDNDKAVEMSGQ
jgi:hypothetical protein